MKAKHLSGSTDLAAELREQRPSPSAKGGHIQTFISLQHRDFRLLLASTFFSAGAQWVQQITIGWFVYQLTGSELLLGVVSGLRAIPFLLAGPLGGVAADRFDRKMLLMGTQAVLTVAAFLFALDVALGYATVTHLLVFSVVTGTGWAINQPIRQAVVPSLVPREHLTNAVALTSLSFNVNRILGPTVGGLLLASIGVSGNFFLQAALSFGFLLMIIPVRIPAHKKRENARVSVAEDLVDGVKYVRQNRGLLSQLLLGLIPNLLIMPYMSMLPAFATSVLNVGPRGLGLLYAASGAGALVGILTIASLGNIQKKGRLLLSAAALSGLALTVFALSHWFALSLVALVALGMGQVIFNALNNTIIQLETPENYRGRVMSLYMTNHGLQPAGTLAVGALSESFGVSYVEAAAGLTAAGLTGATAAVFRHIRERS